MYTCAGGLVLPTIEDIVDARRRIAPVVRSTPVFTHPEIDRMAGRPVFVKCENLQRTGSFKIRGAYNRLSQLSYAERQAGVVAFSSGNHAQGVAYAAKLLGMPATIVMPSDAPAAKVEGVKRDGATIVTYDRDRENREDIARQIAADKGALLVPSFDDPHIIAGQGTVGLEFIDQLEGKGVTLSSVYCCAGGGGLIAGLSMAFAARMPGCKVYSAEPEGHDDHRRSLEAGEIIANEPGTRSICDALLSPEPGKLTFAINQSHLEGGVAVSDAEILEAMAVAMRYLKIVVEPGGAAALAAVLSGKAEGHGPCGVVITGGNVDAPVLAKALVH